MHTRTDIEKGGKKSEEKTKAVMCMLTADSIKKAKKAVKELNEFLSAFKNL